MHFNKDCCSNGRRFAQANIFEGLENSEIERLWNFEEPVEASEISEMPGFRRFRRFALGHIFEFAGISVNFSEPENHIAMTSAPTAEESPFLESRQSRSQSEDEVEDDVRIEIDQSEQFTQPRRRRAARGDIFEDVPLKNGFRTKYFQLIYENFLNSEFMN